MSYKDMLNYINAEITTIDSESKIASIIEKYRKINRQDIGSFIRRKENYKIINKSIKHLKSCANYDTITENELNDLCRKLQDNNGTYNIENDDVNSCVYLLLVYSLILFFNEKKNIKMQKFNNLTLEELKRLEKEKDDYVFYRGHSDVSWTMCPCFIRGLNESVTVNKNYIETHYNDSNISEKFNKTISINSSDSKDLYFKYSFIQHAVSYSMLIDLTSNPTIATSFALSNTNSINNFNNIDSALIRIKVKKGKILSTIKDINKVLNKGSLTILNNEKFCFGKNTVINNKVFRFNTFEDLLKYMKPEFYIFKYPTSDRMKYQQGSFIYFYGPKLIIFKGRIFYELCDDLEIKEYVIKAKRSKPNLLRYIRKNRPYYDQEHLMNPYKYFNE